MRACVQERRISIRLFHTIHISVEWSLQMPIEAPHITSLLPLTHPWCRDDFLKLFCLFHSYHYFLPKYANRYVMRPLVSYPVLQLAKAASIRKAENIGLVSFRR